MVLSCIWARVGLEWCLGKEDLLRKNLPGGNYLKSGGVGVKAQDHIAHQIFYAAAKTTHTF